MPHLKELVKLHEGKPFEIIGVNTGDKPDAFKAGLKEHGLSWISAYQGEKTPIADKYRVRGFPTYVLLDHEGRIVYKGHDGNAAAKPIPQLLAKIK